MFGINDNKTPDGTAFAGPPPVTAPPVTPISPFDATSPAVPDPMPDLMATSPSTDQQPFSYGTPTEPVIAPEIVAPTMPAPDPMLSQQPTDTATVVPDTLAMPTPVDTSMPTPISDSEPSNDLSTSSDSTTAEDESSRITSNYDNKPGSTPVNPPENEDELLEIKKQALESLTPLVDELEQTPEEKFKTTMMLIQASDNADLIKEAFSAANAIADEKARAQALLDVVNEINYFTQPHEN